MGFEPQTADKPLVNPHKRTTKVNIVVVIGVVVFLIVALGYIVRISSRSNNSEPTAPPAATPAP